MLTYFNSGPNFKFSLKCTSSSVVPESTGGGGGGGGGGGACTATVIYGLDKSIMTQCALIFVPA